MAILTLGFLTFAAGCSDGGGGDPRADAGPRPDAGPDDFRPDRVGLVAIAENETGDGPGFMGVYAIVRDRADVPAPSLLAADGDCAVWTHPRPGFCDPPCTTGFCLPDATCAPWPQLAPAGDIAVEGLRTPMTLRPSMYGYEPQPFPSGDLFAPDATVTITAAGGATPAFSVSVEAVPPLVTPTTSLTIEDGVDQDVTWDAAGAGRFQLMLLVGWHGAPWEAMLLCETDDDGQLTIPGGLIAQLPRDTTGHEPHISQMARFRRAFVDVPAGPIELFVGSVKPIYFSRP